MLGTTSCSPQAQCLNVVFGARFLWLQKATLDDVRLDQLLVLHCNGVSVWWGFLVLEIQTATLGTSRCRPQAPSALHCHGVSMWRRVCFGSLGNHFGASFLWFQKATLGTTSCRPQAPSVLHRHSQAIVFQCGEGVRFGSLGNHFGASSLWFQKAKLDTSHLSFTSSDLLSSNLSLLSASSLLCFSSVHIVGSLTSKLPSIIRYCFDIVRCCWISKLLLDIVYDRRKFRSQTSDNMDRWNAEQGRGREKRKIRRKKSRRERVRREKD